MEGQTPQQAPLFADEIDATPPLTLNSEFAPAGDQPTAIDELIAGIKGEERDQVLLGARISEGLFIVAMTCAMVKVLPEPVTPSRT